VNLNEAKTILVLHRPGTDDATDPQIAEALALTQKHTELASWLAAQHAQQQVLREKFRQINPPAGLKEQIISEQAASRRRLAMRRTIWLAAAAALLVLGSLALVWIPSRSPENILARYQHRMVRTALAGYAMDMLTNDPAAIRSNLKLRQAPADFTLSGPLQHTTLMGCAVTEWRDAKVAMVCFHSGKPLPPGAKSDKSDLWLFVVDRNAVRGAPETAVPKIAQVNRLITATWSEGGKLYFLGLEGREEDLRQYL
jgi:hypothetical protein